MKRHLIGVAAAVLGTMLMGGVVVQTASAAVVPVPTTVELPLFGVPLKLGITTGPGGALTEVTVDPTTNTVADELSPRKVVFTSADPTDPTSTAKVVVKSKKGGQSVSARAGSLAEVSGPGSWSGDLFGTGTATTVAFIIGATVDGGPDITGVTSSDPTAVVGTVQYSSDDDDDEVEQSARVSIKFTDPVSDQSRTLTIKVKVEDEEGETEAKLSISLSRLKGVAVLAAEAAGPKTWTGLLCDNTTATIAYTVGTDGSVSAVSATPTAPNTAEVRTDDNKIDVRFSGGERVRIKVRSDDGMIRIDVKERIRCDSADPTTNVSTTIDDDDDDDDHDGDDNRGRGGHDDDDKDDDNTSTTVTTVG